VKKFKGSGSVKAASNGDSDKSSKKKKRKADKENKSESESEDSQPKKKKNADEANGSSEKAAAPAGKFDWEGAAVAVLESKSGGNSSKLKLKKLKRKVMIRYFDHIGTEVKLSDEEKQKLESKFEKKLNKSDQFSVKEDTVSLTSGKKESPKSGVAATKKEVAEEKDTPADKELKDEVAKVLDGLKKDMHAEQANGGGGAHSFNQWEKANLGDDGANEKFRRLMGLGKKTVNGGVGAANAGTFKPAASSGDSWQGFKHKSSVADKDEVNRMFSQQEEQFKRAVGAKRGMGFGFAQEQQKPKNSKITFDD